MCRSLRILTILALASLAVAGCGKKGLLESPVAADDQGKTNAQKKREAKAAELKRNNAVLDPSDNVRIKGSSSEEEHRPFILDGLLR
jgi:predicted small lipoprotein YifL